jgi:thiol:disulfide interchange protein DsbG
LRFRSLTAATMLKPLPSLLAAVLAACTLLLAGCNDAPETAAQKAAAAAPISVEAIAAEARVLSSARK